MINTTKQDNELLSTIIGDLKDLGIDKFSRDNVLTQMKAGAKMILVEGRQIFEEGAQAKGVDFSVVLRNADYMRFYHPISLFVRVTEEPHRSRIFKLTEGEYFTLPQAVNLLHERPVVKRELTEERKIKDNWYALDERKKNAFGNAIIGHVIISENKLMKSIDRFPIKPPGPDKSQLLAKLKNGDLVPVTLLKNGLDQHTYLTVNLRASLVVESKSEMNQTKNSPARRSNGKGL